MAKREISDALKEALKKANLTEDMLPETSEDIEALSLDDLDEVSGGKYSGLKNGQAPYNWPCPECGGLTWPELAEMIDAIYQQFGRDVTIEMMNNLFFKSPDWEAQFNPPGLNSNWCASYLVSACWPGEK